MINQDSIRGHPFASWLRLEPSFAQGSTTLWDITWKPWRRNRHCAFCHRCGCWHSWWQLADWGSTQDWQRLWSWSWSSWLLGACIGQPSNVILSCFRHQSLSSPVLHPDWGWSIALLKDQRTMRDYLELLAQEQALRLLSQVRVLAQLMAACWLG